MSRKRNWTVFAVTWLLCFLIAELSAAERTVARMGDLRATVQERNWCGSVVEIDVEAPVGVQLSSSSRELQLLLGGVRQILALECPAVQELELTGYAGGHVLGQWRYLGDGQLVAMAPSTRPTMAVPRLTTREQVTEAQTLLGELGYQPGPADGLIGQRTRSALANFLRDQQLPYRDAVDIELLEQLRLAHCNNSSSCSPDSRQRFGGNSTDSIQLSTGLPPFGTIAQSQMAVTDSRSERLEGNDAVLDRFLLWSIGQKPDLAAARAVHLRLRHFDFPEGLPYVSPRELDPALWEARLEAAGALYENQPPVDAVLELPLAVRRARNNSDAPFEVQGASTNRIGDTAAITQILLRDTKFSGTSTGITLQLDEPFFLPAPEEFTPIPDTMIGPQKGRIVGRVEVTLSDHQPRVRGDYYQGGSARADVHSVSLVYQPVIRDNGKSRAGPPQVLYVWTGQIQQRSEITKPSTAQEIASFFGGGVSDGRYILNPRNLPDAFGETLPSQLRVSSAREGIIQHMNLATLLDAQPDRTLAPDLSEQVIRSLLTERERVDLLPLNIAMSLHNNRPTELELREALRVNDEAIRQIVRDRQPALPLAMRFVGTGTLGEYDFDNGGFPLHIPAGSTPWFPSDRNGRAMTSHLPDFIEVSAEEAPTLIDRLSNANSRGNRVFSLVVDYDLTLSTRSGRSGPITVQEADSVQPIYSSMSIGLYVPDDPSGPFHVMSVPEGFKEQLSDLGDESQVLADGALPDELFLTTGKSLLGAIAKLDDSGEIIEQAILHTRAVSPTPSSTFESRKAAFREELLQSARDSYWIGANLDFSPYDADLGGFPITGLSFTAAGHGEDFDGIEPPPIGVAAPEDFDVLRVSEDAAATITDLVGRKRWAVVYLKVAPEGVHYDRNEGAMLMVAAPSEVIFEKTDAFSLPRRADVRIALEAPDRIGVAFDDLATELDVPDALMLDPEGMDLLALSQAPSLYSDAMFQRMLVDRLLKERAAASGAFVKERGTETSGGSDTNAIDWGYFFENPDQPLRIDMMEAILPAFKEWTIARADALPNTVLLPIGGNPHPMTGCRGLSLTNQAQVDMNESFFQANLPTLLAPDIELSGGARNLYGTGRPSAGPDGVLLWNGGGRRNGGGLSCGYVSSSLRSLERNSRPENASFVSAVIAVREQPAVSPISEIPSSFLYRLSVDDLQVVIAEELHTPPERMAGLVVLKADVLSATAYRTQQFGGGYSRVGQIEAGDWDPVVAVEPTSQDILGMTLEMPLSEFETKVLDRMPSAVTFDTAVPGQGMFGHAKAMIDPETGEALAAIYADHVEGKPVIALKRRVEFDAGSYTIEGLKLAFENKYGPNYREDGDNHLYWGALPQEEDTYGYCGAPSILQTHNLRAVPQLDRVVPADEGDAVSVPFRADSFLHEFGWPEEFDHRRAGMIPDISQCGRLVAVRMLQNGRKLFVVTWLFDRALAEQLDSLPRDVPEIIMPDL